MKKYIFLFSLVFNMFNFTFVYSQTPPAQYTTKAETETLRVQVQFQLYKLHAKVQAIEAAQNTFVNALEGLVSGTQWMFGLSLGVISLLFGLATYFQNKENQKQLTFLSQQFDRQSSETKEQRKNYETFVEKQEAKNDKLLTSTQSNIDQITKLLGALEDIFRFRGETAQIQAEIGEIKKRNEQRQERQKKMIAELTRKPWTFAARLIATIMHQLRIMKDIVNFVIN